MSACDVELPSPETPRPPPTADIPAKARDATPVDSLSDSVLWMLLFLVVQRLIAFVRVMLICRWLSPAELGQWDMALAFLSMAAPLAVLGLPGSFGRYVERYRGLGQLRTFLRCTSTASAALAALAAIGLALGASCVSRFAFGSPEQISLALALAAGLAPLAAFNFLSDLFTALRRSRLVARFQFLQVALFAALSLGLAMWWQPTALAVVAAYVASCLLAALVAISYLTRDWQALPADRVPLSQKELWGTLGRFAAWIWLTNIVANLFAIADRSVIVHLSGLDEEAALALVGNLHSARALPLLLASAAGTLAAILLPHLSHDWEAGRRRAVAARLNLLIKLTGFGLTAAGVLVLFAAPLVFGVAFQNKFRGGESILGWTLATSVWMGLVSVTYLYLWCAEKAGRGILALAAGLAASAGLNLWLVPAFGLHGAAWATAAAQVVVLLATYALCRPLGLRLHAGSWLATLLPLVLICPPWAALALLVAMTLAAGASPQLLRPEEKQLIKETCSHYWRKLHRKPVG